MHFRSSITFHNHRSKHETHFLHFLTIKRIIQLHKLRTSNHPNPIINTTTNYPVHFSVVSIFSTNRKQLSYNTTPTNFERHCYIAHDSNNTNSILSRLHKRNHNRTELPLLIVFVLFLLHSSSFH